MGWPRMLFLTNVLLTLWFSPAKGEGLLDVRSAPKIKGMGVSQRIPAGDPISPEAGLSEVWGLEELMSFLCGWDYMKCTEDGWKPTVPCLRQCVFHDVENGESPYWQRTYVQDQSVKVKCHSGYSLPNGLDTISCTENGWSPQPKCIRINSCERPVFENARTENNITWFKLNDKLDYECNDGYENKHKHTKDSITCNFDGWSDIPSCFDSTKACGPPPPIDNGDITSFPLSVYAPSSSVEYQCQSLYQLQGNKTITCRNGEWSQKPKCLRPCTVSEEILEKHNIIFKWAEKQKRYYESGSMQEFKCKNGYHLATSQPLLTICIDGHINYPTCTKSH